MGLVILERETDPCRFSLGFAEGMRGLARGRVEVRPARGGVAGKGGDYSLRTLWGRLQPDLLWVGHVLRAKKPLLLSSLAVSWDAVGMGEEEKYRFVPHLHPLPGQVAADQVFRSPAMVLEGRDCSLALVPDLDELESLQRRGLRASMTLEGWELSYRIMDHRVRGHVYFRERPLPGHVLLPGREVRLAYFLFLSAGEGAALHRRVNTFLWERFGRPRLERREGAERDLMGLARLSTRWFFLEEENWVELDLDGERCGGIYTFNLSSLRPPARSGPVLGRLLIRFPSLYPGILRFGAAHVVNHRAGLRLLRWQLRRFSAVMPSCIQMQSWFNLVRTAYGGYWMGMEAGEAGWKRKGELALELALRAPAEKGLPAAVLYILGDRVAWVKGTRGFHHWDWYHLPDVSTTGFHLLEWHRDLLPREEILRRCREIGEGLLRCQLPGGAFPAWVRFRRGELQVHPDLREGASTAAPVMFLAFLSREAGEEEYLRAALAGADFLAREVLPFDRWEDYETFFSCSPKPLGWKDPRSGCRPENTMCMIWAARAFLELFLATRDEVFLRYGRRALDRLLCYQQVWSPPTMSIDLLGGFASQNTDGEWNDARQGLIAPLLVDYYLHTGEEELLERGLAALRACFATMYLGQEPYPLVRPSLLGAIEENYAHSGFDGTTAGYIHNDWGPGTAVYAFSRIYQSCGQVLVDVGRGKAYPVDFPEAVGCRVEGDRVELEVPAARGSRERRVFLKFRNLGRSHALLVNGEDRGRWDAETLRRGLRLEV